MSKYTPDPTVVVPGFGTMPQSQLKKEIKNRLETLSLKAKSESWNNVVYDLLPNGTTPTVLQTLVKALADSEKAMSTPQMKRAKTIHDKKSLKEGWLDSKSLTDFVL